MGDNSGQHIVLGAKDDAIHGGGGDDWLYGTMATTRCRAASAMTTCTVATAMTLSSAVPATTDSTATSIGYELHALPYRGAVSRSRNNTLMGSSIRPPNEFI